MSMPPIRLEELIIAGEKWSVGGLAWVIGVSHAKTGKTYEDSFRILPLEYPWVERAERGEIFAVFDGIGSARFGKRAAEEMSKSLERFFREPTTFVSTPLGLIDLLFDANMLIFGYGMEKHDLPLGGCAGTIAWLNENKIYIFHAGDTLGLLVRDDEIIKLTKDHSAPDGAIYRYFGIGKELKLHTHTEEYKTGDLLILVTDGVTKRLDIAEIAGIARGEADPNAAALSIVRTAQARRSSDDITALVVQL